MIVEITQVDIDRGRRLSADRCPVARAIRRSTPLRPVRVGATWASLGDLYVALPPLAQSFILNHDLRHPTWPTTFELPDA